MISRLLLYLAAALPFAASCLAQTNDAAISPSLAVTNNVHLGLLYDQFPLTLEPGIRTELFGPLYYSQETESEDTTAFPPILALTRMPAVESSEFSLIYPVFTQNHYGSEYRGQLLQLLNWSGGLDPDGTTRDRFTLFPLYFQQRSSDPSQNYTALFPIGGHLRNRLFRDDIRFVLFPIYSETRKKDVVTDNYLYPIVHVRRGDQLHGWQVWPIVGEEHKDVTTSVNNWGEKQIIGGHDKFFMLWPIYFDNHMGIGTDNPQTEHSVLPFYSEFRSPKRDQTTVIWPLFSHVIEREKKYDEWQMPWPLIVFANGEGKTTHRVFPFYSKAHDGQTNVESDFFLWPLYKYNRVHVGAYDRDRMRILFILYSDTNLRNTDTGKSRRRVDFWPLWTHRRDFNGNTRLQILAPLEPILPSNVYIEREYSPIWSIWRSEKNPTTGAASQSILWNLYRHESSPTTKKCSLLFGLFQYESNPEIKRVKLLYIPVIRHSVNKKSNLK